MFYAPSGLTRTLAPPPSKCYSGSMTETITIRLKRSKSELRAKAKPKLNAWVNNLIENALAGDEPDWEAAFKRRATHAPVRYIDLAMRRAER